MSPRSIAVFQEYHSCLNRVPAAIRSLMAAFSGGTIFGLFSGLFYNMGQWFTGPKVSRTLPQEAAAVACSPQTFSSRPSLAQVEETNYIRTKYMLKQLGLDQYEKNFKNGMLDDKCLLLLTDSALHEAKVPPGPRLQILNYVDFYRGQARAQQALTPSMAVPGPNGQMMTLTDPVPVEDKKDDGKKGKKK